MKRPPLHAPAAIILAVVLVAAGHCNRHDRPSAPLLSGAEAVATINGLSVSVADVRRALGSGRLGGSLDLVLDELLGLTLVLHECSVIDGPPGCQGPDSILVRSQAFLDRLFPPDQVCRTLTDLERSATYDRLSGRRFPKHADPEDPAVRFMVEHEACQARVLEAQRTYVKALRKGARVEVHQDVLDRLRPEEAAGH